MPDSFVPTEHGARLLLEEVERYGCRVLLEGTQTRLRGERHLLPPGILDKLTVYKPAIVSLLGPTPQRRIIDLGTGELLWESSGRNCEATLAQLAALAILHPGKALAAHWRRSWYGGEQWVPYATYCCPTKKGAPHDE